MTSSTPTTLSVVGCGYLGAVHACAMAELGHRVIGFDVDADRVAALNAGRAPFYEPGLDELLERGLASGRLRFSAEPASLTDATIHFLCVGTPQAPGEDHADLTYLNQALDMVLPLIGPGDIVVGKSTVPVGTASGMAEQVRAADAGASLVWNPEFLREGFAIEDTLRPDRIVIGVGDDDQAREAGLILEELYAEILELGTPLVRTDFQTAELAKTACNAFLATKISFINAMADLCDAAGGDVTSLADIMGHDARIGRRFLNAGVGFGGGCLPKDIRAFAHRAGALGAGRTLSFLQEVDAINRARRERVVSIVQSWFAGDVVGRRIAVLGASFKPDTDDIRDSPALATAEALHIIGADVVVTDPRGLTRARTAHPQLAYADTVEEAVADADLVVLLTEWREFLDLDPALLAKQIKDPRILDGRNALDAERWIAAGWEYRCLGRPRVAG